MQLTSSDRVNHTHMVYQEVWSNAAVGQQEREGWVGAEQKGEDSRADTLPTPAPGHLIQTTYRINGAASCDGCCHTSLNFFFFFLERVDQLSFWKKYRD